MSRTKAVLPPEIAEPIEQLSDEIFDLQRKLKVVQRQLEDEVYRLAVVQRRPVTAIARAARVDPEAMKKRVYRIRDQRGAVQDQEAA